MWYFAARGVQDFFPFLKLSRKNQPDTAMTRWPHSFRATFVERFDLPARIKVFSPVLAKKQPSQAEIDACPTSAANVISANSLYLTMVIISVFFL